MTRDAFAAPAGTPAGQRCDNILDDIFMPGEARTTKPKETPPVAPSSPSTNGTHNRLDAVLNPTTGTGRLDLLDQLAEMPDDELDALIRATSRRLNLLLALRGAGDRPEPVAEEPQGKGEPREDDDPARGGVTEERQEQVVRFLAKKGKARSSEIAKALGIRPNGLSRFLRKEWLVRGKGRFSGWALSPLGKSVAARLQGAKG
ncbi:MAG: hypothetical protein JWO38_7679 [Gemmataceae bacterium]|nr:hypothetical protein [Gemmataceae bacterium]